MPQDPHLAGGRSGAVVITGLHGGPGGNAVKRLEVGDAVSISTRLRGWPGVVDVMGGSPLLVKDGHNVAPRFHPGASYFYNYNPRTAVGLADGCSDRSLDTDCNTYIPTVDGRQSGVVQGHAHAELARAHPGGRDLGAEPRWWRWHGHVGPARARAYCEDRLAGGCLVTRPSDGAENGARRSRWRLASERESGPPSRPGGSVGRLSTTTGITDLGGTAVETIDRTRLADLMERERETFRDRHPRSGELAEQAKASLLFGVPMNWMIRWPGDWPVFVDHAEGAHFTDVDGNDFVDFCLGDTGGMAGHGPKVVGRCDRRAGGQGHHADAAHRGRRLGGRRDDPPVQGAAVAVLR